MRLFHTLARTSTVFDDPNLVSSAGLVPVLALADRAGLRELADEHLTVPMDKGANAGLKVASLSAYDLTCLVRYDFTCRSRRGDHGMGSPPLTRSKRSLSR
jgi:hypothetical protein